MADEYRNPWGRRPAFDVRGSVRGFRSRPGAPMAARDTALGVMAPLGSPDHDRAWDQFFGQADVAPRVTAAGARGPQDYVQAAITANEEWLANQGIAVQSAPV